MPAVLVVTAVALAVNVLAFGWLVRCGAGLPLAFALAYSAGRLISGRASWLGLAAATGIQFLVLVRDSAAGLEIIPVTACSVPRRGASGCGCGSEPAAARP